MKKKLIRITTVPDSLRSLLEGQLIYMNNYFQVIAISSGDEKMKVIGDLNGVVTYSVQMTRKITPIKDALALWKLYKIFKEINPEIVHTHTPKAGTLGMIASKLARVPHRFHTIAGLPLLEESGLKRRVLNMVEMITYACATKIYPNSFGLKDIILREKFTIKDKLKVLANGSSNGIDTEYFNLNNILENQVNELKSQLNIKEKEFVFIYVGRLVRDKGVNELVSVFDKLSSQYNYVKLLLVGGLEDDLDPLNMKTLDIMKINDNVISVGFQKDVRPFFAISDILTFPSYREGFPNVVMQAGAMSLPSIVTDINGCNEIIVEKINGHIIPVKDEKALFDKMRYYLENPEEIIKMKDISRKMIVERYQRSVVIEALLEEYNSLN